MVLLKLNNSEHGFHALSIACLHLLFSLYHVNTLHLCALVDDFEPVGAQPDKHTGMWQVKCSIDPYLCRQVSCIISLHDILCAAHLIPVFCGTDLIPNNAIPETTLDSMHHGEFYVNKYVDHHAFEILF